MPSVAELAELDDDELVTRLAEYRRELLNLRFQLATSQLDNPARMPTVRRDIARILTLMREREIALAEGREVRPVVMPRPVAPRRRRASSIEPDVVEEDLDVTEEAEEAVESAGTGVADLGEAESSDEEEALDSEPGPEESPLASADAPDEEQMEDE